MREKEKRISRVMINATLKQTVARRPNQKPAARFKLLVDGRVRGVWEKRAAVPRLVTHRPVGTKTKSRFHRLRALHPVFIAAAAACLLAVLVLSYFLFRPVPVGPLELPAARHVLMEGLGGAEADDDSTPDDAGPLVLKKLILSDYRVKRGDSLPAIAKKMNVSVDTLISFNAITDARRVTPGTKLSVPNHSGLRYRVRRGDALSLLSRRFGVSLDDLLDWNNLKRSVITVGQTLFIPDGRLGAAAVSKVLGTLFAWPAKGRISSYFGQRVSPITGRKSHHNGLDIANDPMTSVKAAADGRVARVDYNPTYGNYIILVHGNGFQTLYGHLKKIYVKRGREVAQGTKIAAMGSTGSSTGPHLHFSIFKNGRDVDPLKYLH